MKKQQKIFLILAGLAVAALALWFFLKKRKKAGAASDPIASIGSQPATASASQSPAAPANDSGGPWPIQNGSKNKYVTALQQHLNKDHKAGLVVDGNFGPKTEAAALKFEGKASFTLPEFNKVFGK